MTALSEGSDAGVGDREPLHPDRIKHLEFIQATISRLGTNSFLVKGWALTLAAGLLALSASRLSWHLAAVGVVPLVCFWYLDCFFLRQERAYRRLYDEVRRPGSTVEPLSMNVASQLGTMPWREVWFTPTLLLFYTPLLLADLALLALAV
ncbi:hypothetical protein F8R89_15105 [Streptomyces sp. SS1-1]|uniref:hypothetical protein n=1 Tax=unclassified Streptomyces TaxID=2593676 RepID=UPI0012505964|nr:MULTISPECIES: hypothetical protein [unclassified Streptomyces]KAB2973236.1 hypothetical protein F8R89_15105 [Streptomyces sp. SS1-1]MDI9836115.1 hypothetical protein [Streptomyces sp. KAU_LT]